ncbi:lytic transglycosylase domain-containing protein [Campylobacter gracilis]|uniref:Transglycosylase SLT domain protein n=1 Tax=Campylobacter gracilis RM3268 TaxID=553220 RepID=C8PIT5_9BACT|nr:lytic transglycosylase domain-containing protein [Campylobacter gracilis]AKT92448.1 membrane-bound lytic murein transglycosylase D [Campylobacter gracilis]EEV16840.1 transglycosylase SLT domain protein [Campylobacter gracilis RM3268]UEB45371.1 transglycosylase SLT domain-containing protein [Campylobacter gracilis]SUW81963.1 regulatory protein dnir [Campylobacter gracilis]
MKAIKFILLALLLVGEAFASQPGLMRANHDYILNQFGIENNESSKNVVAGIFRAINASDRKQFKHIVTSQSHNAYLVKSEVDNIEAPEFLLYLAMVESHLKNTVTSGASAGGMWQLMPATAKNFGLRVDSAVDERRDPAASTDAAFSYILHLKQNFGKWYLALMAYNCGDQKLKNAIAATGSDDLDRLLKSPALPNETKNFIKRIIKYAYIAQNENMRKILLFESEPWGLKRIAVAPGTKLSAVAKQIGISPSQMQDYNAHIKNGISPLNGKYFFYIPQSKYAEFVVNQGAFQAYEPRLKQRKPGRMLAGLANELSLKDKNEIALNNIKFNK